MTTRTAPVPTHTAPVPTRTAPVPSPPTVAWFCPAPPATPCPPQVSVQIIDTIVYRDGVQIGRYADDEDPTQQQDVALYRSQGSPLVLAGIAQGTAGTKVPGATSALEWYPWPVFPVAGPPPGYSAYILQGGFNWPGFPAPTARQIQQSYCATLAYHPQMIIFYYWTPAAWAAVNAAKCPAPRS